MFCEHVLASNEVGSGIFHTMCCFASVPCGCLPSTNKTGKIAHFCYTYLKSVCMHQFCIISACQCKSYVCVGGNLSVCACFNFL